MLQLIHMLHQPVSMPTRTEVATHSIKHAHHKEWTTKDVLSEHTLCTVSKSTVSPEKDSQASVIFTQSNPIHPSPGH